MSNNVLIICGQFVPFTRSLGNSIRLFSLDPNQKVSISKGCSNCSNTGYQGRIAIAECIQVDKELKEMIHNNASENMISDHVFKMSQSIDDASKDLILNGITFTLNRLFI